MSVSSKLMAFAFQTGDARRDAGFQFPPTVRAVRDLRYGPDAQWHRLDVYLPKDSDATPYPVIVDVHGGGYFYGTKETYLPYCATLAAAGFAVVNFSYRLAPQYRYPVALLDTAAALAWVGRYAAAFEFDLNNVFLMGDSAGAQLTSQYALAWADPSYADLVGVRVPGLRLAGLGLNCGFYDLREAAVWRTVRDYFGPDAQRYSEHFGVLDRIDERYPPTRVTSGAHDFLQSNVAQFAALLESRGVAVEAQVYGDPDDRRSGNHVFHLAVRTPLAQQCNADMLDFFHRQQR